MSGLAALLAGRVEAGTYRWEPASEPAEVRDRVEHAGWRFAHLDGSRVETRRQLLDALGPALGLVGYHGRNLDALEECVRDLPERTVVLWEGWGVLARAHERVFRGATDVLTETRDRPGCWVLLRGDGPDLDLPLLR